jgi:hypothetical protein
MTTANVAVQKLKDLVDHSKLDPTMFPVKTGNRINIGSYSIKENDIGYTVKSYKSNKIVAHTDTKAAALAVAKLMSKNKPIGEVLMLDKVASKYKTDCVFYKYTMKVTSSKEKWESTWIRYDIAKAKQESAIEKIKKFIL